MKMNRTKVNKALCWFWILVKLKLFNIYLSCSFEDSMYINTLYVATGSKFFSLNKLLFTTCSLMWIRFHIEKTDLGLTDSEHIFFLIWCCDMGFCSLLDVLTLGISLLRMRLAFGSSMQFFQMSGLYIFAANSRKLFSFFSPRRKLFLNFLMCHLCLIHVSPVVLVCILLILIDWLSD